MIVIMEEGAAETQIQQVVEKLVDLGFDIHRSTGMTRTVLGVVGDRMIDIRDIELMKGVREVVRVTTPYKLASRQFRPEGTRIRLSGRSHQLEIGGTN